MSDVFTIWEARGSLDNLKVSYIGDGNNIVIHGCSCHKNFQLILFVPVHLVMSQIAIPWISQLILDHQLSL